VVNHFLNIEKQIVKRKLVVPHLCSSLRLPDRHCDVGTSSPPNGHLIWQTLTKRNSTVRKITTMGLAAYVVQLIGFCVARLL
jgi:hypothetical protein